MATNQQHKNLYDLAIIGSGPAGASAAERAADLGLSTVVLDRASFPRTKTCGGFISNRALKLLPPDLDFAAAKKTYPVNNIKVLWQGKEYAYNSATALGLLMLREQFDQILIEYARSKGVLFIENHPVTKISPPAVNKNRCYLIEGNDSGQSGQIYAKYIIAADGAFSLTARSSTLRAKKQLTGWAISSVTTKEQATDDSSQLIFYPLPFRGGMAWSFQCPEYINYGVGGLTGRNQLAKIRATIFSADQPLTNDHPFWPLPFLGPLQKAGKENLLLCGDAAGLVEPYSGEGIYNALLSAELAVSSILEAEQKGLPASPIYQLKYNRAFRHPFFQSLLGAALLHGQLFCKPSGLPKNIVNLMKN